MVDLSEIAKDVGLAGPSFITPAAWALFEDHGRFRGGDLQGRLLSMLRTLQIAMTQRKGPREEVVYFSTHLERGRNKDNKLMLKAAIKNPSSRQPMITVMLPSERGGDKGSQGRRVKS